MSYSWCTLTFLRISFWILTLWADAAPLLVGCAADASNPSELYVLQARRALVYRLFSYTLTSFWHFCSSTLSWPASAVVCLASETAIQVAFPHSSTLWPPIFGRNSSAFRALSLSSPLAASRQVLAFIELFLHQAPFSTLSRLAFLSPFPLAQGAFDVLWLVRPQRALASARHHASYSELETAASSSRLRLDSRAMPLPATTLAQQALMTVASSHNLSALSHKTGATPLASSPASPLLSRVLPIAHIPWPLFPTWLPSISQWSVCATSMFRNPLRSSTAGWEIENVCPYLLSERILMCCLRACQPWTDQEAKKTAIELAKWNLALLSASVDHLFQRSALGWFSCSFFDMDQQTWNPISLYCSNSSYYSAAYLFYSCYHASTTSVPYLPYSTTFPIMHRDSHLLLENSSSSYHPCLLWISQTYLDWVLSRWAIWEILRWVYAWSAIFDLTKINASFWLLLYK